MSKASSSKTLSKIVVEDTSVNVRQLLIKKLTLCKKPSVAAITEVNMGDIVNEFKEATPLLHDMLVASMTACNKNGNRR